MLFLVVISFITVVQWKLPKQPKYKKILFKKPLTKLTTIAQQQQNTNYLEL